MQNVPKPPINFCIVLFDGFSNMAFASVLEPLRAAKKLPTGPEIYWQVTSITNEPVQSSSGFRILPDNEIEGVKCIDYLVIISGYGTREYCNATNLVKLHKLRRETKFVIGVDSGAWVMASMDLLNEHEATIHWQEASDFEETFPHIKLSKYRYVKSGPYITCGGASSTLDMTFEIIKDEFGQGILFDVANLFTYNANTKNNLIETIEENSANYIKSIGSTTLRVAVDTMLSNIEEPKSIKSIAEVCSTSLRSMNRTFRKEVGLSPGKYYQLLRLTRARDLIVETDKPISHIAILTGFSGSSALSRAFSSHYNMTIGSVRSKKTSESSRFGDN